MRYQRDIFYDANDNIVRIDVQNKDDQGVLQPNTQFTRTHQYDVLDNKTRTVQEADSTYNVTEEYAYDANRNLVLLRKGEAVNGRQPANVVATLYDERDMIYRVTRGIGGPGQSTTQYDYDGNGNRKAEREGIESGPRVTAYVYDGYDRLIRTTDPMGNITTVHYDPNGNRSTDRVDGEMSDELGAAGNQRLSERTYTYDAMDRLVRIDTGFFDERSGAPIGDGLSSRTIDYTDGSMIARRVDDNSHQTQWTYDSAERIRTVTDARGNTSTRTYDAGSNLIQTVEVDRSDLGNPDQTFTTTYQYDGIDRLIAAQDNVGATFQYRYDSRGHRTTTIDPRGNAIRYAYDGLDRLVGVTHDMTDTGDGTGTVIDQVIVQQSWDDSLRLTSQTDDNGNATRYAYDALDRLIVTQAPDGTIRQTGTGAIWTLGAPDPDLSGFSSGYDVHGNRVLEQDANDTVLNQTYDLLERLKTRAVTPGPGVDPDTTLETYQYDGMSRLVSAQDDDSLVTRDYDSLSNLTREMARRSIGPARFITTTYDGEGNPTRLVYPGGLVVVRTFDVLDRPSLVRTDPPVPGSTIASFFYIGPGRVERRDNGNATRLDLSYDGVRKVARGTHSRTAGGIIDDRQYTWDPHRNKSSAQNLLTFENRTYAYDSLGRLVQSSGAMVQSQALVQPQGALAGSIFYNVDGVGNRIFVSGGPNPGSYFLNATLPEPADYQTNQYTFTPLGSRQYDRNGNLIQTQGRQLYYDYKNRLVRHSVSGQDTTYRHDALGRRIERVSPAGTARWYYQGWQEIEEQNGSDATLATLVWGEAIDELLLATRGGVKSYFHADDLGSVVKATDASGNVVEQYAFGDYGAPSFFDASGSPIAQTAIGNATLFTGRRYDPDTNLYDFRTRDMDPVVGSFTQRDTLGTWGDQTAMGNAVSYVSLNPTGCIDPTGTMSIAPGVPLGGDGISNEELMERLKEAIELAKKLKNAKELADTLQDLYKVLYEDLSEEAKKKLLDKYSWELIKKALERMGVKGPFIKAWEFGWSLGSMMGENMAQGIAAYAEEEYARRAAEKWTQMQSDGGLLWYWEGYFTLDDGTLIYRDRNGNFYVARRRAVGFWAGTSLEWLLAEWERYWKKMPEVLY